MAKETVIVGGNIQGNISSCEYKVSEIITGRPNLFVTTKASLAVNNCTNEMIKTEYWSITETGFMSVFIGGLLVFFLIGLTIGNLHSR